MGTQKKIVDKIINKNKADYVIGLKGNQGTLHTEVIEYFGDLEQEGALENVTVVANENKEAENRAERGNKKEIKNKCIEKYKTIDHGHGRIENRIYIYSTLIDWMVDAIRDWAGLTGIGMVIREVTFPNGEKTLEKEYYIGSVNNAEDFARAVRSHWGVKSMHWSLDVTFKDDANKSKRGQLPQNMAVLKRIAFNTVKNDTVKYPKDSMKGRRFIASMDFEYRDFLIDLNFRDR